jgi:hypothetical protein
MEGALRRVSFGRFRWGMVAAVVAHVVAGAIACSSSSVPSTPGPTPGPTASADAGAPDAEPLADASAPEDAASDASPAPSCLEPGFQPPDEDAGGQPGGGAAGMMPGADCGGCHGAQFAAAGSVFFSLHAPKGCDEWGADGPGADAGASLRVVLTDAKGTVTEIPVQGGWFELFADGDPDAGALVPPFGVVLDDGVKKRAMTMKAPHGDCNACHTAEGTNGAPGRIVVP